MNFHIGDCPKKYVITLSRRGIKAYSKSKMLRRKIPPFRREHWNSLALTFDRFLKRKKL